MKIALQNGDFLLLIFNGKYIKLKQNESIKIHSNVAAPEPYSRLV